MSTLVITVALIVGVVLAIPYLLWAQRQPDAGMRLYAIGLGVTAVLYLLFAVIGGAGGHSIGLESLGVLILAAPPCSGSGRLRRCWRSAGRCTRSGTSRSTSTAPARRTLPTGIRGAASASTSSSEARC